MNAQNERAAKRARLLEFAEVRGFDAILLQSLPVFSWYTAGAGDQIDISAAAHPVQILVTEDQDYILADNIEAPRMQAEESLSTDDYEYVIRPWHQPVGQSLAPLIEGKRVGTDLPTEGMALVGSELARLRVPFLSEEVERYRRVATTTAIVMGMVAQSLRPGQTEYAIAGAVAGAAMEAGLQAIVNLVAVDERVFNFRHPVPTDRRLEKQAMLVICARQYGMVVAATRLVHFGPLPAELASKHAAVQEVDATFIAACQPGTAARDVFARGQAAYADAGYPDEWQHHHQGGPIGYRSREAIWTPDIDELVQVGQAFAWNPSIKGTKSEDTVLITENGPEVLSVSPDWPMRTVVVDGIELARPEILIL